MGVGVSPQVSRLLDLERQLDHSTGHNSVELLLHTGSAFQCQHVKAGDCLILPVELARLATTPHLQASRNTPHLPTDWFWSKH